MGKLNVKAFGLSCGIVWGLGMLITNVLNMIFGWGRMFLLVMASVYIGLKPTILGVIIGTVWGFVDGAVAGIIFAWLYNKLSK